MFFFGDGRCGRQRSIMLLKKIKTCYDNIIYKKRIENAERNEYHYFYYFVQNNISFLLVATNTRLADGVRRIYNNAVSCGSAAYFNFSSTIKSEFRVH